MEVLPFSDMKSHNAAVYNVRKMPLAVARSFLQKLSDVKCDRDNIVFESTDGFDWLHVWHLLREYDLEIAARNEHMTLFVANSEESFSEVVDYLRKHCTDDGHILPAGGDSKVTWRFCDGRLRKKFLSGFAKVILAKDFFDFCRCSCESTVKWYCSNHYTEDCVFIASFPSAMLTRFMYDIEWMKTKKLQESRFPEEKAQELPFCPKSLLSFFAELDSDGNATPEPPETRTPCSRSTGSRESFERRIREHCNRELRSAEQRVLAPWPFEGRAQHRFTFEVLPNCRL